MIKSVIECATAASTYRDDYFAYKNSIVKLIDAIGAGNQNQDVVNMIKLVHAASDSHNKYEDGCKAYRAGMKRVIEYVESRNSGQTQTNTKTNTEYTNNTDNVYNSYDVPYEEYEESGTSYPTVVQPQQSQKRGFVARLINALK